MKTCLQNNNMVIATIKNARRTEWSHEKQRLIVDLPMTNNHHPIDIVQMNNQ